MQKRVLPEKKLIKEVYIFLLFAMGLTGFGQMPIFKRYYIADIPGLGWLADFYFTHYIHYLGAIVLFALVGYCITAYVLVERHAFKITWSGYTRAILIGAIMVTGIFRVLKNLPNVLFSPDFTLFIDISHLVFMILFLLAVCLFLVMKSPWLRPKAGTAL